MMHLGLSIEIRHELKEFSSIFKGTEEILNDSHVQECLKYVARRKKMGKYHSLVDFLFCELFPFYRGGCFRFYAGEGPQLKDILNKDEILYYDNQLLKALTIAVGMGRDEWRHPTTRRRADWMAFKWVVRRRVAQ